MELDKLTILKESLRMFKVKTEQEIKQCNQDIEKLDANEEEASEELLKKSMYACYLDGVLKVIEIILELLNNDAIDKALEELENIDNGIAKA